MSEVKKANEILIQQQPTKLLSLQEVLESYSEIELTEEEKLEGLIWAKRKKLDAIQLEKRKSFEEANRKLKAMKWDFDIIKTFMVNRAKNIFGVNKAGEPNFILDKYNESVFDLLSYYFIGDEVSFNNHAAEWQVENPSIKKGLLIAGVYGTGKTWLMKLFSRNNRQCFDVVRSKDIAKEYLTSKDKIIPTIYTKPIDVTGDGAFKEPDRAYPSDEVFNQRYLGICIDDLGSEDVQNNFGNRMNVIGDLIESRYASGFTGLLLHGTTNMTADDIKKFYGGRVASRMKQIFNLIELPGEDRRK